MTVYYYTSGVLIYHGYMMTVAIWVYHDFVRSYMQNSTNKNDTQQGLKNVEPMTRVIRRTQ